MHRYKQQDKSPLLMMLYFSCIIAYWWITVFTACFQVTSAGFLSAVNMQINLLSISNHNLTFQFQTCRHVCCYDLHVTEQFCLTKEFEAVGLVSKVGDTTKTYIYNFLPLNTLFFIKFAILLWLLMFTCKSTYYDFFFLF